MWLAATRPLEGLAALYGYLTLNCALLVEKASLLVSNPVWPTIMGKAPTAWA